MRTRTPRTVRVLHPEYAITSPSAPSDSAAVLADVFARQVDELAAMVDAENRRAAAAARVIASSLGELHVALDELAHRLSQQDGGVA